MQLATLSVLIATYAVVAFALSLSLNFKRILVSWGDNMRIVVYLKEEVSDEQSKLLKSKFGEIANFASVLYISREKATENFKNQMASYAPGLLTDAEFAHPFPASFQLGLAGAKAEVLESVAQKLLGLEGVEDVSYGQSWIKNYSSFVNAISVGGSTVVAIMLLGGIFVVGNSIRASIASRREEIEILELVGATNSMIRRPYIVEGALLGAIASCFALLINYGLYLWQVSLMKSSLALARVATQFAFLSLGTSTTILLGGTVLGALGAWMTVSRINDGWAASQRFDA
jgi:cell division transport system permease protein